VSFIFWFVTGPDFRFGYGYIFFVCFVPASLVIEEISKFYNSKSITTYILLLLIYSYAIRVVSPGETFRAMYQSLLFPSELKKDVAYVERQVKNFTIKIPVTDDRCFNIPVPCSNELKPNLEMRGTYFYQGFKIAK
jgi:hypothetical protein